MTKILLKVPVKVPVNIQLKLLQKLFSEPKIHIAKKNKDGKSVVTTEKPWHVFYFFRNPYTGAMEKFIEKKGINRVKSIKGRKEAATSLKNAIHRFLQEGYSPFKEKEFDPDVTKEKYTCSEAIELAFLNKKSTWKESTIDVNSLYLKSFKKWLHKYKLDLKPIENLSKKHISFYLDYLSNNKKLSNTSRNNHKRFLSSLFSELAIKDIVATNFVISVPLVKATPKKNKPFSKEQLHEILTYSKENDPYLHSFLQVMWYSFLRPIELVRLKIENVNLNDRVLDIETKTNARSYIRIIEPLALQFENLKLQDYKTDMFLFSKSKHPDYWETKREKSREDFFIRRFKKVKNTLNISDEYGVYSFRHSAALSLFNQYQSNGLSEYQALVKVQQIMRHTDEQTTRTYLREIGGMLPKDWSGDYNFEML